MCNVLGLGLVCAMSLHQGGCGGAGHKLVTPP